MKGSRLSAIALTLCLSVGTPFPSALRAPPSTPPPVPEAVDVPRPRVSQVLGLCRLCRRGLHHRYWRTDGDLRRRKRTGLGNSPRNLHLRVRNYVATPLIPNQEKNK